MDPSYPDGAETDPPGGPVRCGTVAAPGTGLGDDGRVRYARFVVPPAAVALATSLGLVIDASRTVAALLLLLAVVGAALLGRATGVAAAVLGTLALVYWFTDPAESLRFAEGDDAVAAATFLVVGVTVGTLVNRSAEASRRAEAREREARERDQRERQLRLDAEVSRTRAAFFAAAGHNLRTPLASIAAAAAALQDAGDGLDGADRDELLVTIRDETDRLTRLVDKVLSLSRIRSGAFELELLPIDLAGLVQVTIARLGPLGREHRFVLDVPPDLRQLRLDPTLTEQLLLNVLENAVQHAPVGSEVTVRAEPVDDAVEVRVMDHGPGIPVELREAVFEEFVRVDPRPEREGTGLGLAIVRSLSKVQGGDAWCEGTPGGGATLVVRFPAVAEDAETGPPVSGPLEVAG